MKAFLYRACAIIFSHFVLYPDYRISFFIPLAFRFADYTGIGLVVCAFFPGFIECLNAIPGVVMGAVLLYLMASQLSAGMQMMIREKAVDGFDGGLVVGFSLMVALLLSFAPDEALNSIPALIRPIVGNGFVMGVITVLILEHLIFRSGKKAKKE